MSVHGVQPVMWVGSVDNWLNVTPTKDSVSVSRTSGYGAPDGLDGLFYKDRDDRTWVNGTCTKSC
ncbi:hypothetical protein WKI68_02105 [Streptomyces sp. MS1.HAVA.3]|uniref:Uncharacterized protein n=1 Tax=Streptomyces caledonius TaxID=3134107 RepID=A0ABU8TY54_9ACTN